VKEVGIDRDRRADRQLMIDRQTDRQTDT